MLASRSDELGRRRSEYDAYAARYDAETDWYDRLLLGDARVRVCGKAAGSTLEVCVGTGRNLPLYPSPVSVTGIDLSYEMLAIARGRGTSARLVQGDAQLLPFADSSFDTVVCTLGLSSVPDDAAVVGEMRRVLRVGGQLLLLGHVRSPHPVGRLVQWVMNRTASSRVGDTQDRQVLPLVLGAGLDVIDRRTRRWGVIEELTASLPGAR